jgi:XapX domain-containing protein
MKIYLLSMGAGLLAGLLYSVIGVRSPAPPAVALVGLLGILLGEQMLPAAKRLIASPERNIMIGQNEPEDSGKGNA